MMNLQSVDRRYLARDVPPHSLEITKSQGSFLISSSGRRYIDFTMGWCVGNLGWDHREIKSKMRQFRGPDYVGPHYLYRGWAELAELLATITPGKLKKSFRATGGTEAVEIALQAAMMHTKRQKFISVEGAYHGDSIAARNIGSPEFGDWYKSKLFHSHKIKPPLNRRAADQVEKWLKKKDVAALIMEPIICNLGVLIPEQEFMTRIQALCRRYGTLLIMDEVATGFGRTGKLFATDHFGIEPDIICLAKAITGGFGGLGATVTTDAVEKSMEYPVSYYSTYGWHPLSVEAAIANIKYILKHQNQLEKNTAVMSEYFRDRLDEMNFKSPVDVRVKGLAIGIECGDSAHIHQIVSRSERKGLLLSVGDEGFTMFPALNIAKTVAQEGLDILASCL